MTEHLKRLYENDRIAASIVLKAPAENEALVFRYSLIDNSVVEVSSDGITRLTLQTLIDNVNVKVPLFIVVAVAPKVTVPTNFTFPFG